MTLPFLENLTVILSRRINLPNLSCEADLTFLGTRWVPLPGASHCKIPSHRRNFPSPLCQQERVNYMVASLGVDVAVVETVCGGVVDARGPVLFGSWVQLESLTIGVLPLLYKYLIEF